MGARFFQNPYADVTDPQQSLAVGSAEALNLAADALKNCIANHTRPTEDDFDGCLYTGYVGIAWAALYTLRHKHLPQNVHEFLLHNSKNLVELALTHLTTHGHSTDKLNKLSMLLGGPGIWITAAMLFHQLNDGEKRDRYLKAYAELAPHFQSSVIFKYGSDEFFVGRAGYLAGIAHLRYYTGEQVVPDATIYSLCNAVVQSGVNYAQLHGSHCPLMFAYYGVEYLGAGHGLVGILFALMLFPGYFRANPASQTLVQQTLDYLIQVTPAKTGNLPCATDELGEPEESRILVHWCHGATGAVLAYARAYILWKDPRYLAECRRCADVVWTRGLLKKGPGICHGVAGSGYVFLLMYRLTGESVYLHRASLFAKFMQTDTFRRARRPDRPYSLFEGLAGTACFYADLANAHVAAFPLMDPCWDVSDDSSSRPC